MFAESDQKIRLKCLSKMHKSYMPVVSADHNCYLNTSSILPSSPPFGDILELSDLSFEFSLFMITSSILPPSFPFGDILKLSAHSFEFSLFMITSAILLPSFPLVIY